ncbi:hypothetical protein KQX54_018348 [Cotesia glomerata]|uniref:Uncharacterized protein n=1 Tax=Cotesia glomerata TaxID=32391 RepID=A0AAV7ID37_COTGL|nr:hypothetical protein KQX54_018348 [Cotesia glomerata]
MRTRCHSLYQRELRSRCRAIRFYRMEWHTQTHLFTYTNTSTDIVTHNSMCESGTDYSDLAQSTQGEAARIHPCVLFLFSFSSSHFDPEHQNLVQSTRTSRNYHDYHQPQGLIFTCLEYSAFHQLSPYSTRIIDSQIINSNYDEAAALCSKWKSCLRQNWRRLLGFSSSSRFMTPRRYGSLSYWGVLVLALHLCAQKRENDLP